MRTVTTTRTAPRVPLEQRDPIATHDLAKLYHLSTRRLLSKICQAYRNRGPHEIIVLNRINKSLLRIHLLIIRRIHAKKERFKILARATTRAAARPIRVNTAREDKHLLCASMNSCHTRKKNKINVRIIIATPN